MLKIGINEGICVRWDVGVFVGRKVTVVVWDETAVDEWILDGFDDKTSVGLNDEIVDGLFVTVLVGFNLGTELGVEYTS